jgi:hypothetical protein
LISSVNAPIGVIVAGFRQSKGTLLYHQRRTSEVRWKTVDEIESIAFHCRYASINSGQNAENERGKLSDLSVARQQSNPILKRVFCSVAPRYPFTLTQSS